MMQIWALVVDSFRETRDKKLFWVMLLVSTIVALSLASVGFDENGWSFFFGAIKHADPLFTAGSPAAVEIMARIVSDFLIDFYIGWVGTVVCLVVTAGIFPSFMESGAIDVVLSKPMPRAVVFAGKYIGALGFVLVQSTYFVLLSFVVLRLQLGVWLWGYLWSIPLLVALFSFVYCVCVLFAMWSRSSLTSLVLTLLFWMSLSGVDTVDGHLSGRAPVFGSAPQPHTWNELGTAGQCFRVAREALPKTGDISVLVSRQIGASTMEEWLSLIKKMPGVELTQEQTAAVRLEDERQAGLSTARVVGGSLIFEGVVLLIAGWMFCRRDF